MTPDEQGRLTVAIEQQFRATLREVVARKTSDPQEQLAVASAVVALLLRKLYQEKGKDWLETVLRMVLQP